MTRPDYWLCRSCGCLWQDNHNGTVSLAGGSSRVRAWVIGERLSCEVCEALTDRTTCDPLYAWPALKVEVEKRWREAYDTSEGLVVGGVAALFMVIGFALGWLAAATFIHGGV